MDKSKKIIRIISGSLLMFLVTAAPVFAFDGAILSEIKISSKDNYSYKVTLKTNKDVYVQKNTVSDNKIVIDLNNAQPAEFVNTIYNNSPEINNVIVQPVSKDKVRVFIEGLNISSSKVILDSRNISDITEKGYQPPAASATDNTLLSNQNANNTPAPQTIEQETPKTAVQNVDIIDKAKAKEDGVPVIDLSDYHIPGKDKKSSALLNDSGISPEENADGVSQSALMTKAMLKKVFSRTGFDWLLRIFATIFIVVGILKLFSRPKKVTVGLSSENIKLKELEMYRSANGMKELLSKSMGSQATREQQINNAYSTNSNYGVKEYQNSQLPPKKMRRPVVDLEDMKLSPRHRAIYNLPESNYDSQYNEEFQPQEFAQHNSSPIAYDTALIQNELLRKQQVQQASGNLALKTKPSLAGSQKISKKEIDSAKAKGENVQFLETMASIYEKSGRNDLARNIRQSIVKVKTA